jgi:hypothetical protein
LRPLRAWDDRQRRKLDAYNPGSTLAESGEFPAPARAPAEAAPQLPVIRHVPRDPPENRLNSTFDGLAQYVLANPHARVDLSPRIFD